MNRDQIIAALDAAFADHISKLFGNMMAEYATNPTAALKAFANGMRNTKAAYISARAEIDGAT